MVKLTVHTLGEHIIDNLIVTGPASALLMEMLDLFLASYTGPPDGDLDYNFAEYIINFSHGQGEILEWEPNIPKNIH